MGRTQREIDKHEKEIAKWGPKFKYWTKVLQVPAPNKKPGLGEWFQAKAHKNLEKARKNLKKAQAKYAQLVKDLAECRKREEARKKRIKNQHSNDPYDQ